MDKIPSFTVNHLTLNRGVYVSRRDLVGQHTLTTFDIRMTKPNREPVINTAEIHALEHLGATFLRNHPDYKDQVIYFGPMGCRTGFYLILVGDYDSKDVIPLLKELYGFMAEYDDEIPGASAHDCGNFRDMNLPMAKYIAADFLANTLNTIEKDQLNYPK